MSSITRSDSAGNGWSGVELRHLVALEAVVTEGSFGRAADRLGYTQSAVSQQIATLERVVGERLLERPRGPRAVTTTEPGALLLRHAQAIRARLEAAQADLAALRAGETGTLRVGTYQSVGARVLPEAMRRFRVDRPGIELELTAPTTDPELYVLVESGAIDLAFCSLPVGEGPFEAIALMNDPYVLVVPADHELAERAAASLADLDGLPLIGSQTCNSGRFFEEELRERGVELAFAFRSDDNGTVQGLVAAGYGAALVPLLSVMPGDPRVRVLQLEPPVPPRRLAVAWHRDRHRSPAARAFVELARVVGAEVEDELAPYAGRRSSSRV
jgi:DNA-binding transcriptional LysR family regulator